VKVRPPTDLAGEGHAEPRSSSNRRRISDRRLGLIYAVLAAVAWSTAGILQRQLHVNAATQVAGRGVFGFIALAGYAAYTQPGPVASVTRRGALLAASVTGRGALLAAGAMAVANSAFIISLNYTSVAHVLVLQSIAPLVAAGLGVVLLGERLTWRTACAMAVALGGVIVMVGAPGGGPILGDGLSLLTGVAFALVIVIARRYRGVSMAPAMALAQLLVVIVFAPFAQFSQLSWADVGWLALLGCGQIGLGAIFFISAARFIPSSEMAMIFLLEVVLGPLWTWIALSETPNVATLAGGAAVIVGVGAQVGGFGKREDRPMADGAEQPQGLAGQRERPPGAVRNLAAVRLGGAGSARAASCNSFHGERITRTFQRDHLRSPTRRPSARICPLRRAATGRARHAHPTPATRPAAAQQDHSRGKPPASITASPATAAVRVLKPRAEPHVPR
jgi:drug/metabolite transporter (DMT)-like permease